MEYSLSDSDLKRLIPNVNIIKYNDLANYNNIDELLQGKPTIILFELTENNNGHWISIFKNNNTIYFFDSYGIKIEDQKKYMNKQFFRKINYLSKMLKDSPYKVDYNANKYQEMSDNISTCGRHCVVRLKCQDLNDEEYKDIITDACNESGLNPDELVVELTQDILGK